MPTFVLTVSCPDRKGIVAALSTALVNIDANILQNAQFSDPTTNTFCMRVRFEADIWEVDQISEHLSPVFSNLDADANLRREDQRRRALIMVSKYDHCLVDLLYRRNIGELAIDVPLVVSNHPDLRDVVLSHGLPFEHIPVSLATKAQAEQRLIELVAKHDIDFVVLARYMQILSDDLCRQLAGRIINIHHSFLPGFKGAKPYHQAHERGVKLIGATAHYVTGDLDEGPIIAQAVGTVTHRDSVEDAVAKGRDIERAVLASAVKAQSEDRIFLVEHRTVVFD
jgi:formyltetrahydrofolate deformylase